MAGGQTLIRLPNGQIIRTTSGVTPQQNGRALTPNQRMGVTNYQSSTNSQFTGNRSMSPIGSEIPGEKQFIETNTGEALIISNIGIFASRKGEDRYVPLQFPEQILFAPFVQLQPRKNLSTMGNNNYVDPGAQRPPMGNVNDQQMQVRGGTQLSQGTPSPLDQGFGKNKISPGQFLYSIQKPDGTVFQQPGGQLMIVQNYNQVNGLSGSGRIQGRSASTNAVPQRFYQNPQVLANYQPNAIHAAQQADQVGFNGLQNMNVGVASGLQQLNQQYFTNSSSQGNRMADNG